MRNRKINKRITLFELKKRFLKYSDYWRKRLKINERNKTFHWRQDFFKRIPKEVEWFEIIDDIIESELSSIEFNNLLERIHEAETSLQNYRLIIKEFLKIKKDL